MFGYLFFSALSHQPNISTLSTLVFLLLQGFEFALRSGTVVPLEGGQVILIRLIPICSCEEAAFFKVIQQIHLLERS